MDDPDRPGIDPALFDRLWDELHKPTYYMGMRVIPFDAQAARRERFIPLKLLFYWLEKAPYPRGCLPDLGLFGLAKRHIRIGHLKTHGPSWRSVPAALDPEIAEVIVDGQVHEAQVINVKSVEKVEPDNPLIDIHDFSVWFREVSPDYLQLPAGFPGADEGTHAPAQVEPEIGAAVSELPFLEEHPGPEPEWLTLKEMGLAFDGLNDWDAKDWTRNFRTNQSSWIADNVKRPGVQGLGKRSVVHPVGQAKSLLIKVKYENPQAAPALLLALDDRFERPPLVGWRDWWRFERSTKGSVGGPPGRWITQGQKR